MKTDIMQTVIEVFDIYKQLSLKKLEKFNTMKRKQGNIKLVQTTITNYCPNKPSRCEP